MLDPEPDEGDTNPKAPWAPWGFEPPTSDPESHNLPLSQLGTDDLLLKT